MPVAIAQRSFRNDPHCGDLGACWEHDGVVTLCMIDGLGHGRRAEGAARAAHEYVGEHLSESAEEILFGCSEAIFHTIGAAMGLAVIDRSEGSLSFAGVGNTVARIIEPHSRRSFSMASDPGIIGEGFRSLFTETVRLSPDHLLLMHTDGVSAMIDFRRYSTRQTENIQRWAEMLLDDWGSENDDRTVLIYKAHAGDEDTSPGCANV